MGVERSSQSLLAQDLGHNPSSKLAVIKRKLFPCLLKTDTVSYTRSMNIFIITADYFFLQQRSRSVLKIVSKVHSSLLQASLLSTSMWSNTNEREKIAFARLTHSVERTVSISWLALKKLQRSGFYGAPSPNKQPPNMKPVPVTEEDLWAHDSLPHVTHKKKEGLPVDIDWGVEETTRWCWPAACWSLLLLT